MKDINIKLEICKCNYCGSYNISANGYMAVWCSCPGNAKTIKTGYYTVPKTIVQQSLSGSDDKTSSPKYQCPNCLEHYFYVTESGLCQGCFDDETQNEH